MKLRPFLRSLSSSQVSTSIEEKNKLKPDAEQNNILSRRKKSSERRLGLKDIGSLQEVMEDRTEAPDKQSECQRNDQAKERKVNVENTFFCKVKHKLLFLCVATLNRSGKCCKENVTINPMQTNFKSLWSCELLPCQPSQTCYPCKSGGPLPGDKILRSQRPMLNCT